MRTDRHCLLQQLAFSKLRHFSWDNFPSNTMAYDRDHWEEKRQNEGPKEIILWPPLQSSINDGSTMKRSMRPLQSWPVAAMSTNQGP